MCPVCHEPLVAFELDGVEIDRCVDCRGVWLDAGELELIAGRAETPPGALSRALNAAGGMRQGKRRCPRCDRKLKVVQVEGSSVVELDRCPAGHGLWLDAGEMESLIGAFETGEEGAVASFFDDFYGKKREASG
jgi:Zn-finger nucleic acid-binding protein